MAPTAKEWMKNFFSNLSGSQKDGINILCIDGGGIKQLLALEVLRAIQKETGQPIQETFDLIGGVSSGAMTAFALGVKKLSLEEARQMCFDLKDQVFSEKRKLPLPAWYDIRKLETIMKDPEMFGETELLDLPGGRDPMSPRVFAVATNVTATPAKPMLMCNYRTRSEPTYYERRTDLKIWQGLAMSACAPLYFEPYKLDGHTIMDGGLIVNNPTNLALDEARAIWGNDVKINAIVSVGTGIFKSSWNSGIFLKNLQEHVIGANVAADVASTAEYLDLFKLAFLGVGASEMVHQTLHTALPPEVPYFRFNPLVNELALDETKTDEIQKAVEQAHFYCNNSTFQSELGDMKAATSKRQPGLAALRG